MKWVIREQQKKESEFNAGSKARNDVDTILVNEGYNPLVANSELDESQGIVKKVWLQFSRCIEWNRCFQKLNADDTIVIQYPVRNHTVFFGGVLKKARKKGVRIIAIIHDLESLRLAISENSPTISKIRFRYEELSALKYFDKIIVHNEYMKKAIHDFFNIPMDKMINLEIFDYLYEPKNSEEHALFNGPVLIAGNLDKNKCGYVYNLPDSIQFFLYGANYDESSIQNENVLYKGKVKPDELPGVLKGSFGLVWDGPSAETCSGVFGEYLKYNDPHKASLYLAAGLPIIVWNDSALADFVSKNGCGLSVNSLLDLKQTIEAVSEKQYKLLCDDTKKISDRIQKGYHLKMALETSVSTN